MLTRYVCAFLMNTSTVISLMAFPYLVKDWFGAGAGQLGLLGGVEGLSYVGTCLLSGPLLRRFSQMQMLVAGTLVVALSTASLGAATSVWYVMGVAVLIGFGTGLFWPALETQLAAGVGSAELRHRMGWFNVSWSSAEVAGTLVGGAVYAVARTAVERTGQAQWQVMPFYLAAGVGAAILVMLWRGGKSRTATTPAREEDDDVPRSPGRGGAAFLGVFWLMALIANSAGTGFRAVLVNIFPDMGKDVFHYSAAQWGALLAMAPLFRTVMFVVWWRLKGWPYRVSYFWGFQAALPLSALLLVVGSDYWVFMTASALLGVGYSMTYFSSIYYSLDSDTAHGARSGLHEAVLGMGSVFAPPLAGMAAWASGMRAPYYLMFALLVFAMGVQVMLFVSRRMGLRFFAASNHKL